LLSENPIGLPPDTAAPPAHSSSDGGHYCLGQRNVPTTAHFLLNFVLSPAANAVTMLNNQEKL
jgi:hypothetical protein